MKEKNTKQLWRRIMLVAFAVFVLRLFFSRRKSVDPVCMRDYRDTGW